MYINKAFIYGNLTRDPELRSLPSGVQVANFAVATNRTYKDAQGQKQESTEYHNVVAFGRLAEIIAQYMTKGRPIYVEGRLQTRSWESEGQKRYRTEIVVENFQFGAAPAGAASGGSAQAADEPAPGAKADEAIEYPEEEINPDDIPF